MSAPSPRERLLQNPTTHNIFAFMCPEGISETIQQEAYRVLLNATDAFGPVDAMPGQIRGIIHVLGDFLAVIHRDVEAWVERMGCCGAIDAMILPCESLTLLWRAIQTTGDAPVIATVFITASVSRILEAIYARCDATGDSMGLHLVCSLLSMHKEWIMSRCLPGHTSSLMVEPFMGFRGYEGVFALDKASWIACPRWDDGDLQRIRTMAYRMQCPWDRDDGRLLILHIPALNSGKPVCSSIHDWDNGDEGDGACDSDDAEEGMD